MFKTRQLITVTLLTLALCFAALAQDQAALNQEARQPAPAASIVTAAVSGERVRFVAGGSVTQLKLEVYTEVGQKVFETDWQGGNVLDWRWVDGVGQRIADGSYLTVFLSRSLSGKESRRVGLMSIAGQKAIAQALAAAQLTEAQQKATGTEAGDAALTVMPEGTTPSVTALTHDGADGQINRTSGALSFRAGDFYRGKDVEQMRLTAEGNLGIGTDQPEARLDVNGVIRARQGFQFADGSVLNLAPKGGLNITAPSGQTTTVGASPNAVNGTANRLPKFDTNGTSLLDSTLYQDPGTGYIGWGTTTPAHPFTVRRNGGTLGVHSFGELYVDRDDRTRSASMILGTGGTLKWIFGMPYQDDGFQVFDLQASPAPGLSRFYVHPTNGNVGIGTNSPVAKLDVVGSINTSSQYNIDGSRVLIASGTNLYAGTNAGPTIIVGSSNTAFGQSAGDINTGDNNSFFGALAGRANTSGGSNSFFGAGTGLLNTTGSQNAFFGSAAGNVNTAGGLNSFFGVAAGLNNTTGDNNAFFGNSAGGMNTTGQQNSFFGNGTGFNSNSDENSFFGSTTGFYNSTGQRNSFYGNRAGQVNTTGSNNTMIGYKADVASGNLNYATAIGADAVVNNSNSVVLGRSADTVRIPGTLIVSGNAVILGNLAKGGGSFQIDHPLDPQNKYLYHSFVESPDMMNVYNGNIVTDKRGLAVITLPAYFEALNRDFRYQLTVVGQFAQAIVLKKIEGNRFEIKTNKPRVEVSWQVTGIRQDPFANANRIQVEVDKGQERGTYLHPQLFKPATTAARTQEK